VATAASTTVPGPPRGRRRLLSGDPSGRIQAMRQAEAGGASTSRVLLRLSRDVILLVKDLVADPRIAVADKAAAGLAAAYVASPVGVIPDWVPVLGRLDDLVVAGWALRRLLGAAGYAVIYEHWRGSDEGLALVLSLAGVDE
jgi:uncharacterized membrane protein YkvA (DUF1232 family)